MIALTHIRVSELPAYVESEEYKRLPLLPISKHRALSHARNPRARPEDVALIIAKEDEVMVGYIGMLPDHIITDKEPVREVWLSTMWVDPQQRGKGIAQQLLNEVFSHWNDCVSVTRYTLGAERLYSRSERFQPALLRLGVRCYLRFNLRDILPKRYPKLSAITWGLAAMDAVLNFFHDIRLRIWVASHSNKVAFDYTNTVDDQMAQLIPPAQVDNPFKRGKEDLNWILQNPWLVEGKKDRRYHFSSSEQNASLNYLKVYNEDGTAAGFAVLNIRNGNLQVPYCFVAANDFERIARVIVHEMVKKRLSTVTVINRELGNAIRAFGPFWLRRKFRRQYLFSKALWSRSGDLSGAVFQDGDGDAAFT